MCLRKKPRRRTNQFRRPERSWPGVHPRPIMMFVPPRESNPPQTSGQPPSTWQPSSTMSKTSPFSLQAQKRKAPEIDDSLVSISDAKLQPFSEVPRKPYVNPTKVFSQVILIMRKRKSTPLSSRVPMVNQNCSFQYLIIHNY